MTTNNLQIKKKQKLRNAEYYSMQNVSDSLYSKSLKGHKFKHLMELICADNNILLAYRSIKKNKGSLTKGTNNNTIIELGENNPQKLISYVKNRLIDYKPQSVRRVEIIKDNGKIRPLGIPTIEDRLIQQCILQVLEPICEAKFHQHNYGFRPNRSTHHAIARAMSLTNAGFNYVVDIDIKGFFDNVNHGKLLKQMWSMGIQDKNLICVISKLLKAEVKGVGIPSKGTPQGGILSPLLSNIVLNELDWWISSQWDTFKTKKTYAHRRSRQLAQKSTNLKQIYVVRYADDFKIFCKNYNDAKKMFIATENWLKERLSLEISTEKSKITNLRKKYSEFLGFELTAVHKRNKYVSNSHITQKAKKNITKKLKTKIDYIQKNPNIVNIRRYNSTVLGMQQYYRIATHSYLDFHKIAFLMTRYLYNKTKKFRSKSGVKTKTFEKLYGHLKGKTKFVSGIALFPINGIRMRIPLKFTQETCDYTVKGREKIHNNLKAINYSILQYIMDNPMLHESTEYNDNRMSLYVGQNGKCAITGNPLQINEMESHHKVLRSEGGTDKYNNLVFVTIDVHKLIHATNIDTISKYKEKLKLIATQIIKINKLRKLVGNCDI